MAFIKPCELLGHPKSQTYYNVTGDGERECLKNVWIGQSAAKLLGNEMNVQRLGKVALNGKIPTSAGQFFNACILPTMVIPFKTKKEITEMAEKKLYITKEELESDYKKLGSLLKVAKKHSVSKKLILNKMKSFGIERNKTKKQHGKDLTLKIKPLALKGLNGREIAEKLKVLPQTVYRLAKAGSIEIEDTYHKGYITTHSGYIMIHKPEHPNCDSRGYVREHILNMEEYLGRYLEYPECVHHLDEIKNNNDIENLELMTIASHTKFHHTGKKGRGKDLKPRKKALKI